MLAWYTSTMPFSISSANKKLFSRVEISQFKKMNSPARVQDFLNTIPFNFESDGVCTIKSPLRTLREHNAHCFEGALLGAFILSLHGHKPLIMALIASETPLPGQGNARDFDHCIAPFKVNGYWGALSKTNHAVLRYREPIYKTLRELAMSYFHEYFVNDGTKTLRYYTDPVHLKTTRGSLVDPFWPTSNEDLWVIDDMLDNAARHNVVPEPAVRLLRPADAIEIEAGAITEWKPHRRAKHP